MRQQAVRYVILGQLIFMATILACVALNPQVILRNDALSFYGSSLLTAAPFSIGLLAVASTLFRAAKLLPTGQAVDRTLSRIFNIIALLMVGLVLTPLNVNDYFYVSHVTIAVILATVNLGTGYWLLLHAKPDRTNYVLFGLEIIGGTMSVLSTNEIDLLNLLATGQIIAIFAFAGLITRTLPQIEHVESKV